MLNTTSAMHENINGRIQNIIAKTKGFKNYKKFRINMRFLFGITKFSVREYAKIQNKMDICKNNFIWATSFFEVLEAWIITYI